MNGWLVPHAPLLLPGINDSAEVSALEAVRERLRAVRTERALVLVTPHGPRPGVYAANKGSLAAFGLPARAVEMGSPERAADVATAWGAEVLREPLDHGAVMPLLLCDLGADVTCISLPEPDPNLTAAITDVFGADVTVVASANGSAGLGPRAPLTEVEGARAAEDVLLDAIVTDAARLRTAAGELPGSCAAGPLSVLADLFEGTAGEVLAHEEPVGVGYTVARFER